MPVAAPLALWVALAFCLQAITTRVADWFVMTDELLYERLAISVDRLGSPLPRVHGVLIPNVDQLYPLLLAIAYRHGLVPDALRTAHALNAWAMSSACIPAFLLARRLTGRLLPSLAVALATVCVPWIALASFLLTESVGYPAFLWAVLAIERAVAVPSRRGDAVALLGIALAILARTQFVVLGLVLPAAVLLVERRAAVARHRLLAWSYALIAAALVALLAAGRAASALGTYGATVGGDLLPSGLWRSLLDHVAMLALGLAILPVVVGVAWMLSAAARPDGREEQAFAAVALATLVLLALEVTVFDLRFGNGVARDRYLFYAAPLVLTAFVAALAGRRRLRASLLASALLVASGFAVARLPDYGGFDADAPASTLDGSLRAAAGSLAGARALLALATLLLAALVALGPSLRRRRALPLALAALALAALPAETADAFAALFGHDGPSGRPLTLAQGGVFDWVDRTVGPAASVTIVPYPQLAGEYWASVAYWWDLEFWNESVDRAAYEPHEFEGTPSTFPKLYLRFDPATGRANVSPSRYVAQSDAETRFRIAGTAVADTRNTLLIDADRPWRADWLTFGLYDDGWTRPGTTARVRVFAQPGQTRAVLRTLTLGVRAPFQPAPGGSVPLVTRRPFTVASDVEREEGVANGRDRVVERIAVCVPAHGFADVRISTPDHSPVYGDMRDQSSVGIGREAGVLLTEVALADEIGPRCRAAVRRGGRGARETAAARPSPRRAPASAGWRSAASRSPAAASP
jgi:MFS family permease